MNGYIIVWKKDKKNATGKLYTTLGKAKQAINARFHPEHWDNLEVRELILNDGQPILDGREYNPVDILEMTDYDLMVAYSRLTKANGYWDGRNLKMVEREIRNRGL